MDHSIGKIEAPAVVHPAPSQGNPTDSGVVKFAVEVDDEWAIRFTCTPLLAAKKER